MKKTLLTISLSVAFSIPATLIAQQLLSPPQRIVAVDSGRLLNEFTLELAKQPLGEAELDASIDYWAQSFDEATTQWAKEQNSVVLDRLVINSLNVLDVTDDIAALIKQRKMPNDSPLNEAETP